MMTLKIRQLRPDAPEADVEAAIAAVTEAFAENEYSWFILGGHTELQPSMNRALVKAGLAGGKVYVADYDGVGIVGAAVWFGPGEGFMKTEAQFEAGFEDHMVKMAEADPELPRWLMEKFLPEYNDFLQACFGPNVDAYKLNGWSLEWFGIKKAFQGRGIGKAMIEYVKSMIVLNPNRSTWHITLDTDEDNARAFYRKLCFIEKGSWTFRGMEKLDRSLTMYGIALELGQ